MQTLLSEHWHAVRHLRPRLRDGVQPLHRRLRGRPWVLLMDPLTQRFHRVSPQVHGVLKLLDGRRTLDEVWQAACDGAADVPGAAGEGTAISQHELVQLMTSLHGNDLLQTQVSPDAGEVFERYKRQRKSQIKQSFMNPMSLRLPLLHPDAWFEKQAWLARLVFTWPMLLLWLVVVAPAGVLGVEHWHELTDNLADRVLAASNVALLWFTYPLVKAVHEWAHGLAVKAWGGTVREVGVMVILFSPVPYVDATSSYRFPSKWARATVAAAGIMAELALGAIAVYVWLGSQSGLVSAFAFNVILIAGVSTLVVNGNPLMRYDGYFIACDLLEMPNLSQRATRYLTYLVDRHLLGSRDAVAPMESRGERVLLGVYGAVAPIYRVSVTLGMIWFVAGKYFFIGVLMALVSAWSSLALPLWRGWKHLRSGNSLARKRDVALRRAAIGIGGVLAFVCLVPVPFHSVQQGVVWLPDEDIVRADAAGQVRVALPRPGDKVSAGQSLMELDNPTIVSDLGVAAASVAMAEAQLRQAEVETPAKADGLRAQLDAGNAKLQQAQQRLQALTIAAGAPGRWMPAAPTELPGRYVKRGEVVGYVIDGPSRRVRAAIPQEDMALIAQGGAVAADVRLANDLGTEIPAKLRRNLSGGDQQLVSQALGTEGGGEIAVDPAQKGGTHAIKRVFDLELEMARPSTSGVFGDRAYVRFDLGRTPLARQWFLRLRQLFLARLDV
jgi:putative peptide zinc metalloprotease protein